MATGGRVLHHLAKRLPDSRSAVLLVGYSAEGTLARALQDGAQYVRIHGQEVPVRAEVVVLDQLSAHAGRSELLRWLLDLSRRRARRFWCTENPAAWKVCAPASLADFIGRSWYRLTFKVSI